MKLGLISPRGPESSKTRRFSRISFARLLPAFVIAFLPFGQFDDALLSSLYALRGKLRAPTGLQTFSYSSHEELSPLAEALKKSAKPVKCLLFLQQDRKGLEGCQHIVIEDFYSSDLTQQNYSAMQSYLLLHSSVHPFAYRPLFYGGIEQFNVTSAQENSFRTQDFSKGNFVAVALVPKQLETKVKVPTAAGLMSATEVGLNVLGNALENRTLATSPRSAQILLSLLTAILAAWILYSYPIFMTLILILAIGASEFTIAAIVFDKLSLQIPLAGPLTVLVVTYLLGMSDRLDRRERREWKLEQESENLKHLDEMRNNFLSLVSHDLKTPIARMQSSLERIVRGDFGDLPPDQRTHIQKIISANGSLQRSISTLLLLSRVETRELHIQFNPTDLPQLLEEAAHQHKAIASDRNITFVTDFEPMFLVNLDQALIREVASNLIDNAMKYSASGSQITIRCGEVDNCPELLPPQPGVWFEVHDQGPGIDKVDRKKVFQKFMRGSNEKTAIDQSIKGTGLGLFLTRFFVEQHNGVVSLFSKTQQEKLHPSDPASQYFTDSSNGSVFRITLPIDQPETVEST